MFRLFHRKKHVVRILNVDPIHVTTMMERARKREIWERKHLPYGA